MYFHQEILYMIHFMIGKTINTMGCNINTPGTWTIIRDDDPNAIDLGKSEGDTESCGISIGNPIMAGTGNKYQPEMLYAGGPATGLALELYYNSLDQAENQNAAKGGLAFGANWHSTWHRFLTRIGDTEVHVMQASGRILTFRKDAAGNWNTDPDVLDRLTPVTSNDVPTGWTLLTPDGATERYTLDGQLQSITTRAGLTTTLSYNSSTLASVKGPFGHTLAFTTDSSQRVTGVTLPDGTRFAFGYDSANNLTGITNPDGGKRGFVYNESGNTSGAALPHALTGIIDENGQREATYGYASDGRAVLTTHDGVDQYTIAYNTDGSATATGPLGEQHTYGFSTVYDVPKRTGVTGGASTSCDAQSYGYDAATGALTRKVDFNNVATTTQPDALGRPVTITEAADTPQARVTQIEWHPRFTDLRTQITVPTSLAGVNRVTRFTYNDTTGALESVTVTAGTESRRWTYQNNSAGQPITVTAPDSGVTRLGYDNQGG